MSKNKIDKLIKIKVKSILKVEFINNRKIKRKQQRMGVTSGWCLITDYNNNNYAFSSRVVCVDKSIKNICIDKEYLINVQVGNNICLMLNPSMDLIKSVVPNGVKYDDKDVIEIYKNERYLSDPYKVSTEFGERMLRLGILEHQREEDVIYIMSDILNEYLTERYHNDKISVYEGEYKDKIIDICKTEIGNKIHSHINIEEAFDIFAKTLCEKTEKEKYFLYKYTY